MTQPAPRFEWERILPRFQWEQVIRALPSTSPLFSHDRCPSRCRRKDGSRLRASTLKHVALTLATFANPDGTRAFPGIERLVLGTSRHRGTVIASLGHLELVGLIAASSRAGAMGRPREFATVYVLTMPPIDERGLGIIDDETAARVFSFFSRSAMPPGGSAAAGS